jgi:hypothetical protein
MVAMTAVMKAVRRSGSAALHPRNAYIKGKTLINTNSGVEQPGVLVVVPGYEA